MRSLVRASRADLAYGERMAKAAAIRAFVGEAAFRFNSEELLAIVNRCGSVPLACDCLTMIPQPSWLGEL